MKKPATNTGGKTSIKKAQEASKNAAHDPFQRLKDLPPDLHAELLVMLRRDSPYDVATILQDLGHCTDIAHVSLSHQLEKYRKALIPQEEMINPFVVKRMKERYTRSVNVFTELSNLVELQVERVREARLTEI